MKHTEQQVKDLTINELRTFEKNYRNLATDYRRVIAKLRDHIGSITEYERRAERCDHLASQMSDMIKSTNS